MYDMQFAVTSKLIKQLNQEGTNVYLTAYGQLRGRGILSVEHQAIITANKEALMHILAIDNNCAGYEGNAILDVILADGWTEPAASLIAWFWVAELPNESFYLSFEYTKSRKYTYNKQGYIYLHRYIMEKHINRALESWEVIHHIDHDRKNNKIENLEIMDNYQHSKIHSKERWAKTKLFSYDR